MGSLSSDHRNSITHHDERWGQETLFHDEGPYHIASDVGMKPMNCIRAFERGMAAYSIDNQLFSNRSAVRLETQFDGNINAVCNNCNKRFKSIRAVSMHLRVTGARHSVNIINHGYYDKKTGLREMNRRALNQSSNFKSSGH